MLIFRNRILNSHFFVRQVCYKVNSSCFYKLPSVKEGLGEFLQSIPLPFSLLKFPDGGESTGK